MLSPSADFIIRHGGITQARNLTPALSAAAAICDHMRNWLEGTPEGEWVSMGGASDASSDIPEGRNFSFPVTCQGGGWHIVQVGPITLLLSVCFYHILVGVPTSS